MVKTTFQLKVQVCEAIILNMSDYKVACTFTDIKLEAYTELMDKMISLHHTLKNGGG